MILLGGPAPLDVMHRLFSRELLERCSSTLVDADTSDEMRALANDLMHTLLRLYDGGRLTRDVLLLPIDSLSLIPDLERDVAPLREAIGESTSAPAALMEQRPTHGS